MPKRSLNPGKNEANQIEQLNRTVDAMFSRTNRKSARVNAEIEPLARIAADLRDLPRASFKERLKSEFEGRKAMATVAEPIPTVHAVATPRLMFKDLAKAIEFYEKAFAATETFRFLVEGKVEHAEIKIGDSPIRMAEEWPEGGRFSAETLGHSTVELMIQVDDVDSFAARAVAAGMTVSRPIRDEFYGVRGGIFVDPFGYAWNLLTIKEEMSVEEVYRRFNAMKAEQKEPAVNPIRRGFHTVTPYIVAPDGEAMLAFAKNAFGAQETFRGIGGAGGIHGEVRIGDTMLMMGGGIPGKPLNFKPNTTALHVYVEDTDAVYQKALEAGATSTGAPQDHEYGERGASVKDPFGNFWYIATHKGESYIPNGLHNVNVYMHPLRAEPVIGFLKRAFGAQEIEKYASPDGVVHHAEIQVGSSVVEMGEAHGPYQPMQSMFYIYAPDCDAAYRRALAAGAKSLQEPAVAPYGDRIGGVADPFGNQWWIATHVKEVS